MKQGKIKTRFFSVTFLSIVVLFFNITNVVNADTSQFRGASKQAGLSVDNNRDGVIELTENKPFVFWINNDNDEPGFETSGFDVAVEVGVSDDEEPDYLNNVIDGTRDLIDFFAVAIDLHQYLNTTDISNKKFYLQHKDEAVSVVFTIMSRGTADGEDNPTDYLKKINIENVTDIFGSWQTSGPLNQVPVRPVFDNGTEIPKEFIELLKGDINKGVILVEGTGTTNQPLEIIVKGDKNKVEASGLLPLNIYPVTELYRRVSITGDLNGIPRDEVSKLWGETPTDEMPDVEPLLTDLLAQTISVKEKLPKTEISNHLIYVHGSLIDTVASSEFQSELFKRLYHSGSNALFTGVYWHGDEGTPAGLNYWDNLVNAFYSADDLAALVNGIKGTNNSVNIMVHSLANVMVGSAIQDYGMEFNQYFMMNPAVTLEAYDETEEDAKEMRNIDWDEYYFGADYNPDPFSVDETYVDQNGRKLWAVEWYTLFPTTDNRKNLTWRDRFSSVGASANVVQYHSSGDEVLQKASAGDPNDFDVVLDNGRNAWNVSEKGKGSNELVTLLGSLFDFDSITAGWGFNGCTYDDNGEETFNPCYELTYTQALDLFFSKPDSELIQTPFFAPFNDTDLHDPTSGSAAVSKSFPHVLAYEMPALSFAAGGSESSIFALKDNAVNMNDEMFDGWPAIRGGLVGKEWFHSDFKDVAYRYTYPLFDDLVSRGGLK